MTEGQIKELPGSVSCEKTVLISITIEECKELWDWGEQIAMEWGGPPPDCFNIFGKISGGFVA